MDFDEVTFPKAVSRQFELNNYKVSGPVQIHGSEVDLVAEPLGDPFGSPIYIEVTIQYVDNIKYGKDLTKLALVKAGNPAARTMMVSLKGFSLPVKERAKETGIEALTYDDLLERFERFQPYIEMYTSEGEVAAEVQKLNDIYEEPIFRDRLGSEQATFFLSKWRQSEDKESRWLVIIGEYGTGKTALTRVLQYRWLKEYQVNPSLPLPLRIELRHFTRQFDARGLLHHFLDHNGLAHIPLDYVQSLIAAGRVVLLLDGYDEMAQYLSPRERRTCLEALAKLAAGGARGLLTSRPNYFTETEELQVFEVLYASIEHESLFLGREALSLLDREKEVDELLSVFLDRYERTLADLTPISDRRSGSKSPQA